MTDYSKLTDPEIDKLAAEMMGLELVEFKSADGNDCEWWWVDKDGGCVFSKKYWTPTKNAQQIQEYLFPKIHEKDCDIKIHDAQELYAIQVIRFKEVNNEYRNITIVHNEISELSDGINWGKKINRTTVICCLIAMDKLKKGDESE